MQSHASQKKKKHSNKVSRYNLRFDASLKFLPVMSICEE